MAFRDDGRKYIYLDNSLSGAVIRIQNDLHMTSWGNIWWHWWNNHSPALTKWCYTGFALSFRHSFLLLFLSSIISSAHHSVHLHQIIFCHTFLKNCKAYKVENWYTHGQRADLLWHWSQRQGLITLGVTSLYRFYNLPLMKNLRCRFLRNY